MDDFDRVLAPRGVEACARVQTHLASVDAPPELVLCSPATRAVQTLHGIFEAIPGAEVRLERYLYGATAGAVLRIVHGVEEDVSSVMVIGHNPGLEDLVLGLTGDATPGLLALVEDKFPTAALATLTFDGPWRKLRWGVATLAGYVVPKELP